MDYNQFESIRERYLKLFQKACADIEKLLEPKPDPRIGKLCKVWNLRQEPNLEYSDYGILLKIDDGAMPFLINGIGGDSWWRHARLLTEAEIDQYVRGNT